MTNTSRRTTGETRIDESKKNATGCLKTVLRRRASARDDAYRPNDGTFARDDEPSRRAVVTNTNGGCLNEPPDRERRKVSLARYRRASVAVMETLADVFPDGGGPPRERRRSLRRRHTRSGRDSKEGLDSNDVTSRLAAGLEASGHVRALRPEASVSDARLALGAGRRARRAVFAKTGYTMSGGIAHNKMLAKLASARNKPNKQTVVSRAAVDEMLEGLPMRSIKGLGVSSASASSARLSNVSPRKTARETRRATGPRPARRGPP